MRTPALIKREIAAQTRSVKSDINSCKLYILESMRSIQTRDDSARIVRNHIKEHVIPRLRKLRALESELGAFDWRQFIVSRPLDLP